MPGMFTLTGSVAQILGDAVTLDDLTGATGRFTSNVPLNRAKTAPHRASHCWPATNSASPTTTRCNGPSPWTG